MRITLVAVCALGIVQPVLGKDEITRHQDTKGRGGAVHVAAAAAKPSSTAAPAKQPWSGRTVAISESERHVIRAYVHHRVESSKGRKPDGVPAGLAKELAWGWGSALPSDWEKTCVPGTVLPPEVHSHCHPLPHEVILKLPSPPPGTVLLAVDGKVLRLGYPTYEILDVFNVR